MDVDRVVRLCYAELVREYDDIAKWKPGQGGLERHPLLARRVREQGQPQPRGLESLKPDDHGPIRNRPAGCVLGLEHLERRRTEVSAALSGDTSPVLAGVDLAQVVGPSVT